MLLMQHYFFRVGKRNIKYLVESNFADTNEIKMEYWKWNIVERARFLRLTHLNDF